MVNNANNTEVEIKLTTVSREVMDSMLRLPLIAARVVQGSERQKPLESCYYDTPNRKFAKSGVVFRVRKEPDGFVGTVKAERRNSGGLSERMEYNVALPDEQPAFDGFEEISFLFNIKEAAEKNGGVEELFTVAVERRQCDLALSDQTVVEMAIDNGEITADGRSVPVCEVEFELKQGSTGELLAFVAALSKEMPLFAEQKSKYFRGMELAGEKTGLVAGRAVREISSSKPFKAALREALSARAGYALACARDCLDSEEKLINLFEGLAELEQLLVFARELFEENKYLAQVKTLEQMIEEIWRQFLLQEFNFLWQEINIKTAAVHTTMLLEKLLQEKGDFYAEQVENNIRQGKYSAKLFGIMAWLETADWRNNVEMSGKIYLAERLEQLHDEAVVFYEKNETQQLGKSLAVICRSAKAMKKFADKDAKRLAKTARALLSSIAGKVHEERAGKTLFSLFRASAGRLLYRDAGILLGYYFKACKYKQEKIEEKFEEFRKAKKMPVVDEIRTEYDLGDED